MSAHRIRIRIHSLLVLGTLAGLAQAQSTSYFVSPVVSQGSEGRSENEFPFRQNQPRRYMQIHSDLPGHVTSIKALGFRANKGTSVTGSTTMDIELYMGSTLRYDKISFYFDRNWIGTKQKVLARKKIQFGPGVSTPTGPSPFSPGYDIKLDAPYVRTSQLSLGWEMLVHSNTGQCNFMDADSSAFTMGLVFGFGSGCPVGPKSNAMSHRAVSGDKGGVLMYIFNGRDCPPSAPCFLMLGSAQASISVPGLCAPLYTNLIAILPIGTSQANGDLNTEGRAFYSKAADGVVLLHNPGRLTIYSQLIAPDLSQAGLPLAVSNGLRIDTPNPDPSRIVEVSRLFNNTANVTEKMSEAFVRYSIGYGLVTRFTY